MSKTRVPPPIVHIRNLAAVRPWWNRRGKGTSGYTAINFPFAPLQFMKPLLIVACHYDDDHHHHQRSSERPFSRLLDCRTGVDSGSATSQLPASLPACLTASVSAQSPRIDTKNNNNNATSITRGWDRYYWYYYDHISRLLPFREKRSRPPPPWHISPESSIYDTETSPFLAHVDRPFRRSIVGTHTVHEILLALCVRRTREGLSREIHRGDNEKEGNAREPP